MAKGVAEIVQEQWASKQRLPCPVPCAMVAFALNHGLMGSGTFVLCLQYYS
jgi:hypothetical protein